jgi:putative PIN family toxin of toxin-antitoxin system
LRIVLDATVLVRAHPRSPSNGRKLLRAVLEGRHELLLSNEIIAETIRVLRYPRLQKLAALTEAELYYYAQFLHDVSENVILRQPYHAPLRDANDLDVMQTAERGDANVLCTNDGDFDEIQVIEYCAFRGIELCKEALLLERLTF